MSDELSREELRRAGRELGLGCLFWLVVPMVVLVPIALGLQRVCAWWPNLPVVCHVSDRACDPYSDPSCPQGPGDVFGDTPDD